MTTGKGMADAERARDFFRVQLAYVDALTAGTGVDPVEAVTWHSNLHRYFGYGHLAKMTPAPEFTALLRDALKRGDRERQLDFLVEAFAAKPWGWPFVTTGGPSDRYQFGCFACEAPTDTGAVRIHFGNRDRADGIGPLDHSKIPARRAELVAMFSFVTTKFPQAKSVLGGSWLYNIEAYRRLFPPAFAASRQPMTGSRSTHGLSSWGQFLDFRGEVKRDIAERFMQNLQALDRSQPWLSFPMQVLATTAPIEDFRQEYGF